MGIKKQIGYSYGDLTIVPKCISEISSRSECNPKYSDGKFPIFTAPMSSVIGIENFSYWDSCGIIPILPRTSLPDWKDKLDFIYTGSWVALGLGEVEKLSEKPLDISLFKSSKIRILIDVANGHMKKILDLSKKLKNIYKDSIEIMAGNIANPDIYCEYCYAGIDYVRCSIGSGAGCLTTSNTGVHFPIASLIEEIHEKKSILGSKATTKIIADGGIRNYSDINKALALGADYVMIGGLFSSLLESSAEFSGSGMSCYEGIEYSDGKLTYLEPDIYGENLENYIKEVWGDLKIDYKFFKNKYGDSVISYTIDILESPEEIKLGFLRYMESRRNILHKEFYGMSTKKAQKLMRKLDLKTSEGKEVSIPVRYTIKQWIDNMESYLKSAMSYCNSRTLKEFIGNQVLIPNSPGEISAVNK